MLETSKDFLNIAIAISIMGIAVFICLGGFYVAMILRQSFKIVQEMRNRIGKIDKLIKSIQDKVEHSSSYLLLIGEGIKKLVEIAKEHSDNIKYKVHR